MRKIYAWTADGRSRQDVGEAAFAAAVAAALDGTPESARQVLAREAEHLSGRDLGAFARSEYPELSWVKDPLGMPQAGFLGLPKGVYRALRNKDGARHD